MRDYEMMIIIDSDLDDDTKRKTVEKIEGIIKEKGGEIREKIDWGMRTFA